MSKVKERMSVNGISVKINSIGMSDAVFNSLPANMKQGDKLTTLSYFRMCLQNGANKGRINVGNVSGVRFEHQDTNIVVCNNSNRILAAYTTQNKDNGDRKDSQEPKITAGSKGKIIQVGDLIINISKLELSSHFLLRVKQRFYITEEKYARKFLEDNIANGKYIGVTFDEKGEEAHLFAKDGTGVFLSLDGKVAKSTYEKSRISSKNKELVRDTIQRKMRGLKRKYSSLYKTTTQKGFAIRREIIDLEEKMESTKSDAVRMACQARKNALEEEHKMLTNELEELSRTINQHKIDLIPFV